MELKELEALTKIYDAIDSAVGSTHNQYLTRDLAKLYAAKTNLFLFIGARLRAANKRRRT